jgi:hypothetical protein
MSLFSALPEDFLHFVWRTRHFSVQKLKTTTGEPVRILSPGIWNHDQGPDFLEAEIRIGDHHWHGQVELHLHSRDWYQHGHDADPLYNNTILHVVLHADGRPIYRSDGSVIPELSLTGLIPAATVRIYERLLTAEQKIPCQSLLTHLAPFDLLHTLSRMSVERIEHKSQRFAKRLQACVMDWEQVLWEELMRYMGGTVNGELFQELAGRIPLRLARLYADEPISREALLFGGAGCLRQDDQSSADRYHQELLAQWRFLVHKHQLETLHPLPFRFSRMRPPNFPTIRLSQTGAILEAFPILSDLLTPRGQQKMLLSEVRSATYWESHLRFGQAAKTQKRKIGRQQKEKLLINAVIPLAYLYKKVHGNHQGEYLENALVSLPPENNRITRTMEAQGFGNENAFHSQGMVHLYREYCLQKRCLHCQIGQKVLRQSINLLSS